jgi:hypothetical protein
LANSEFEVVEGNPVFDEWFYHHSEIAVILFKTVFCESGKAITLSYLSILYAFKVALVRDVKSLDVYIFSCYDFHNNISLIIISREENVINTNIGVNHFLPLEFYPGLVQRHIHFSSSTTQ